jgi:hypothetical protein
MMEAFFSQIESLLDQAAQQTNCSRAQVFLLFANTQTVKRAGRTVWNIYKSYFYEDPTREQKQAGIPGFINSTPFFCLTALAILSFSKLD